MQSKTLAMQWVTARVSLKRSKRRCSYRAQGFQLGQMLLSDLLQHFQLPTVVRSYKLFIEHVLILQCIHIHHFDNFPAMDHCKFTFKSRMRRCRKKRKRNLRRNRCYDCNIIHDGCAIMAIFAVLCKFCLRDLPTSSRLLYSKKFLLPKSSSLSKSRAFLSMFS